MHFMPLLLRLMVAAIILPMTAGALLGGRVGFLSRLGGGGGGRVGGIGNNKAAAEAQQEEYFAMLPWEVPTRIELMGGRIKSSLDLRAFIQPFNRSGAVMTGVFVCQDGLTRKAYPQSRTNGKDGWRPIGLVAAIDEESLPLAIQRQRGLIIAWANEYIRDYSTDAKVFNLGSGAPPVRIAYGERPSPTDMRWIMDRTWEGDITEVPLDTPVDASVRCGFFGSQSRSQMGRLPDGRQSGFRYVGIELPD